MKEESSCFSRTEVQDVFLFFLIGSLWFQVLPWNVNKWINQFLFEVEHIFD